MLPSQQGSVAADLDAVAGHCTTREQTTHKTEIRRVEYPWHPLHGRDVHVYGVRVHWERGEALRCKLEPEDGSDCFEIPAWMFERARCAKMHLGQAKASWESLVELRKLLDWQKQDGG